MITAVQEREFYDRAYSPLLSIPEDQLHLDRAALERDLSNPAHPFYERARLYRSSMRALEAEPLEGKRVLDYGCGAADFGIWMATEGANVTLLDLSPVAIEFGLKRARRNQVASRVAGVAADASWLPMFDEGAFDLVFACGSLHHTMKYAGAVEELARVMRPGARLVLCETWGGNPALNLARHIRARLQREEESQGEDIVMSGKQLRRLAPWFDDFDLQLFNLIAMGKRLLRGRLDSPAAGYIFPAMEAADRFLFKIIPALRGWCGEAVITARRK